MQPDEQIRKRNKNIAKMWIKSIHNGNCYLIAQVIITAIISKFFPHLLNLVGI